MNEDEFWDLIEKTKQESYGNCSSQTELLIKILSEKSIEEILDYTKNFWKLFLQSYTSELWAMAHILNGGCSNDTFDYFRGWLIAQGRNLYEIFMKHPDEVADLTNNKMELFNECEFIIGVSRDVYIKKTGNEDEKIYNTIKEVAKNYNYGKLELEWDESNLNEFYPKFYQKYNGYSEKK